MTNRSGCSAIMVTLTNAQRAQQVLSRAAIPSSVVKALPDGKRKGCAWSVEFACNQLENVKSVFASAEISVKAWEGE